MIRSTVAEATQTVTATTTVYPVLPSGFNFTIPTIPGIPGKGNGNGNPVKPAKPNKPGKPGKPGNPFPFKE